MILGTFKEELPYTDHDDVFLDMKAAWANGGELHTQQSATVRKNIRLTPAGFKLFEKLLQIYLIKYHDSYIKENNEKLAKNYILSNIAGFHLQISKRK